MNRLSLAALLLATLLTATPARASGGGYVLPFPLDPYGGRMAEQDAFYGEGHLGVLLAQAPWSRLFAAWRMLHGRKVGLEAGRRLALPCCDADGSDDITKEWRAARMDVPGVTKLDNITVYRQVGDFFAVQTCFADAFATAARTLRDRIAARGATDPAVAAWLTGQDAVFVACHQDIELPPLPGGAPAWLVEDRAYQQAARALYERHFPEAETRFGDIAVDPASPWRPLAPCLAARAAVAAAIPSHDPASIAGARTRLLALAAADAPGHAGAAGLAAALDFRTEPDARRTVLVDELLRAALKPTVAADFKDLRRLGQSPAGQPEFLDWLTVFGRIPDKPGDGWFEHYDTDNVWKTDEDARAHAVERWTATKDPAWLIAALQATAPGPDAESLAAAARALPAADPAWLTAAYHRIRLAPGEPADSARDLDAILARTDLSVTTRNLFTAQRAMVAASQADFLRFAQRVQACAPAEYGAAPTPQTCLAARFGIDIYHETAPEGRFGDDALATIDRLPLEARGALAEDASLSAPLRLDVTLTTWTRAALMGEDATADRMARGLVTLLPAMAPEFSRFTQSPPGEDKRFAAWFALLKLPGAATHLVPGPMLDEKGEYVRPGGDYQRPTGGVKEYEGYWPDWIYAPIGSPPVAAYVQPGDIVCQNLCGSAGYPYRAPPFAAIRTELDRRERGRYAPASDRVANARHVWEDVLAYVQAHPDDPRAPETLYQLIRVSRFGHGHARSSFRAFRLLKSRYAATAWVRDSRYFYD